MIIMMSLWHGLSGGKGRPRHQRSQTADPCGDLKAQVTAAQREWQAAKQYFQSVTEPQLVDHAVHAIIAAEQKYMYLLKQLRHGGGNTATDEKQLP